MALAAIHPMLNRSLFLIVCSVTGFSSFSWAHPSRGNNKGAKYQNVQLVVKQANKKGTHLRLASNALAIRAGQNRVLNQRLNTTGKKVFETVGPFTVRRASAFGYSGTLAAEAVVYHGGGTGKRTLGMMLVPPARPDGKWTAHVTYALESPNKKQLVAFPGPDWKRTASAKVRGLEEGQRNNADGEHVRLTGGWTHWGRTLVLGDPKLSLPNFWKGVDLEAELVEIPPMASDP